jgi:hypothetical protein
MKHIKNKQAEELEKLRKYLWIRYQKLMLKR